MGLSRVIIEVAILLTPIRVLITSLTTSHDPPSTGHEIPRALTVPEKEPWRLNPKSWLELIRIPHKFYIRVHNMRAYRKVCDGFRG